MSSGRSLLRRPAETSLSSIDPLLRLYARRTPPLLGPAAERDRQGTHAPLETTSVTGRILLVDASSCASRHLRYTAASLTGFSPCTVSDGADQMSRTLCEGTTSTRVLSTFRDASWMSRSNVPTQSSRTTV